MDEKFCPYWYDHGHPLVKFPKFEICSITLENCNGNPFDFANCYIYKNSPNKLTELERAIRIAAQESYKDTNIENLMEKEAIPYKNKEEWIEWKINLWKKTGAKWDEIQEKLKGKNDTTDK